jgi:hypothetical protein
MPPRAIITRDYTDSVCLPPYSRNFNIKSIDNTINNSYNFTICFIYSKYIKLTYTTNLYSLYLIITFIITLGKYTLYTSTALRLYITA